jgi:hypothetical protein
MGCWHQSAMDSHQGKGIAFMSDPHDSAFALIELLMRKAPEYLDLMTARTDAEFEAAFDAILGKAIAHLEKNKKNFQTLHEEGLSGVLAAALSMPGLTVTQEAHSNGHVDLTIEAEHRVPARTKLAEAKMYAGFQYHTGGLAQLLGRYTTGREGRGLLIVYVRKKGISGLVRKLRNRMDKDLPLNQQGKTEDHILKWSFISTHAHACGDDLQVGHIGCNLYIT